MTTRGRGASLAHVGALGARARRPAASGEINGAGGRSREASSRVAARGRGASLARGRLGWRPGPPRRVAEGTSSRVALAARSCSRYRRQLVPGGWHGLPWCIATSNEGPGRRAPRRKLDKGASVGRTELGTIALMKLIGKRGPSQGKGGETPGDKEKGMVFYGIALALCFANGQTGRWAGRPGGCRRLNAVLGRG